jgi:hypothetical protein
MYPWRIIEIIILVSYIFRENTETNYDKPFGAAVSKPTT